MLDLVTAGEAFDDFVFHGLARLPRHGEEIKTDRFVRSPGGGALIAAVAASRLGLRCGMLGGLSPEGERLLRDEGVYVRNLKRRGEPSAISIALSTKRDRAFVTFNGMHRRLPARIRAALARVRARHVHLAFYPQTCRPWAAVVRSLRVKGIASSWDFGWSPGLRRDPHFWELATAVDYLFVNRDEALAYARARPLARALDRWRRSPRYVVVKLGAEGSRIVGGGVDIRLGSTPARVIDTTGAGDAFNGAFLAGRLRGLDLQGSLAVANRVGALSTRRPGGIAGLPKKGIPTPFSRA